MGKPQVDYAAVFQALPTLVALFTPQLTYADVNEVYANVTGRTRDQLIGRYLFDAFPDNPADPTASGTRNVRESLQRVLATGERDSMALQRYDVEEPDQPGVFRERYWSIVNTPVHSPDGQVELIVNRAEEVTALIHAHADGDRARVLEAELYTRAREVQEANEQLRRAHARERRVALALQEAMLPTLQTDGKHQAVARYRPAVGTLNICGDWYDLVGLTGNRVAVAVGDVVGQGLAAASVMGQLRSALSAAARVADGPAQALEVLGQYAQSVQGAESTTAVQVVVDWTTCTVTYSSAGHLPPALLHADGTVQFLDQATDPPLGARLEHVRRPQATAAFTEGATLVLYTDGLIERRREDIDAGLARLTKTLTSHQDLDIETLADTLLSKLLPLGGGTDDTALVLLRL